MGFQTRWVCSWRLHPKITKISELFILSLFFFFRYWKTEVHMHQEDKMRKVSNYTYNQKLRRIAEFLRSSNRVHKLNRIILCVQSLFIDEKVTSVVQNSNENELLSSVGQIMRFLFSLSQFQSLFRVLIMQENLFMIAMRSKTSLMASFFTVQGRTKTFPNSVPN